MQATRFNVLKKNSSSLILRQNKLACFVNENDFLGLLESTPYASSLMDATTLGITTFSLMTLSIMGLFATLSINETQHNDTQYYSIEGRVTLC